MLTPSRRRRATLAGALVLPLALAACGLALHALQRHAGAPLKGVVLRVLQNEHEVFARKGEALISRHGLQGSLIYAASSLLREAIAREGAVTLCWDLFPEREEADLWRTLQAPRGLVLMDPPYEAQEDEFRPILKALRDGLERWPTGTYALWYPIKRGRTLQPFLRKAALLPCKSALRI